jgi:sugar phosphate isomerase/epimerase
MIDISVASDNFRHDDKSIPYYLEWSSRNGCKTVEMNTVNGEDFFEGLGFSPAISLNADMMSLRKLLDQYKLEVSQLDCHYALHTWQSIPYMIQGIKAAKTLNCPYIATTDGAEVPEGMTLDEVYNRAVYHIGEVLRTCKQITFHSCWCGSIV